ncbi:MAG: hypothetical protein AAF488_14540, partial [Planctomycetota bacterium]
EVPMLTDEIRARRSVREFHQLPHDQRLIVCFAEYKEDWNDLSRAVERLSTAQGRSVVYLTSDPDDPLLKGRQHNLHVFYVGRGGSRKKLFKKIDANVVVVPRPYVGSVIPRSREDVHYALVLSTLQSVTTQFSAKELAPYRTVFCSGRHQLAELRDLVGDSVQLLEHGNGRLDSVLERRDRRPTEVDEYRTPSVLIAPHGPELITQTSPEWITEILDRGFKVTLHLRPDMPGAAKIAKKLTRRFEQAPGFRGHCAPATPSLLFTHQAVITDGSDLALQYALGLERPVIFVDLPRRDGSAMGTANRRPLEVSLRDQLGTIVPMARLLTLAVVCEESIRDRDTRKEALIELRERLVFHGRLSGAIGSAALEAITLRHDPKAALERALAELRSSGSHAA